MTLLTAKSLSLAFEAFGYPWSMRRRKWSDPHSEATRQAQYQYLPVSIISLLLTAEMDLSPRAAGSRFFTKTRVRRPAAAPPAVSDIRIWKCCVSRTMSSESRLPFLDQSSIRWSDQSSNVSAKDSNLSSYCVAKVQRTEVSSMSQQPASPL